MNKDKMIKVGDVVIVNFNQAQSTLCFNGKVLSMPMNSGEPWIIEDLDNGHLHYISEHCTITKIKSSTEDSEIDKDKKAKQFSAEDCIRFASFVANNQPSFIHLKSKFNDWVQGPEHTRTGIDWCWDNSVS